MKFLLLLVVIAVALYVFKSRQRTERQAPRKPRSATPAAPAPMLSCARCGVHLPASEAALDAEGRAFCSAAHLGAGPR